MQMALTLMSVNVNTKVVFILTLLLLCVGAIIDSKKK